MSQEALAAIREGNRLSAIGFTVCEQILRAARIRGRNLIYQGKPLTSERLRFAIDSAIMAAGGRADDTIVAGGGDVPYPSGTSDLHHEVELVVALGRDADGVVPVDGAMALVFGYGVGLDLTRRDLQAAAKQKGHPWDTAKGFDASAPISEIVHAGEVGDLAALNLSLEINGEVRQQSLLDQMIWNVPEILHELSLLWQLRAGDLEASGFQAAAQRRQGGVCIALLQPGQHHVDAGIDGAGVVELVPAAAVVGLQRAVAALVVHLRMRRDPVAQVDVGQTQAARLLDLPQHVVGAIAGAGFGLEEGVDG